MLSPGKDFDSVMSNAWFWAEVYNERLMMAVATITGQLKGVSNG
jgi:hypothetical protein|tara:strand:+ start:410 stop:541 length:132 start_codon:yes stop_codon:yes gene_type:complete